MEKVILLVDPGICGFKCKVVATRKKRRVATVEILESECDMINDLGRGNLLVSLNDLFVPHTKSLFFKWAEKAHCHLCCPVPIAIIKAAEVALELSLPQDVSIRFD